MPMQYLGVTIPVTVRPTSKGWPSKDPEDMFEHFVCDLCAWDMCYRMYGSFPIDTIPSVDKAVEIMLRHQGLCQKYNQNDSPTGEQREKSAAATVRRVRG